MPANQSDQNNSGNEWFGSKDAKYLKKLSREAVEKHTNTSVLFFEVDYAKSKRNFYGEMLIKVFKQTKGIKVNGIIKVSEGGESSLENVPNKLAVLEFSCYITHLQELGIRPQLGDYLTTKNKVYMIHQSYILDTNQIQIATDREAIYNRYVCIEVQDDQLTPPGSTEYNSDTYNNIEGKVTGVEGTNKFE